MRTTISWPTGAPARPSPGDVALGCSHAPGKERVRVFYIGGGPLRFRRPDGTEGDAAWVFLCDRCYERHGDDPLRAPITVDCTITPEMLPEEDA